MAQTWYDVSAIDANGKRTDVGQYDDEELDRNDHVEQADWRRVDHSRGFIAEPVRSVALGYGLRKDPLTGRIFDNAAEAQ